MSENAWLRLDEATYSWGSRPVLDSVTLSLRTPRLAWLSGPSGSGKTTFLRVVAGHHRLESGSCEVLGEGVHGPGADRSFVFQDFKLFPWKSVFENVATGLRFLRFNEHEIKERVEPLLYKAGLYACRHDWPHQLSGGMQQRVGILRSLVVEPKCLLIDEPFSALDEDTANRMWTLIEQYLARTGAVCLISSHNPRHVRQGNGYVLLFSGDGIVEVVDSARAHLAGIAA